MPSNSGSEKSRCATNGSRDGDSHSCIDGDFDLSVRKLYGNPELGGVASTDFRVFAVFVIASSDN